MSFENMVSYLKLIEDELGSTVKVNDTSSSSASEIYAGQNNGGKKPTNFLCVKEDISWMIGSKIHIAKTRRENEVSSRN